MRSRRGESGTTNFVTSLGGREAAGQMRGRLRRPLVLASLGKGFSLAPRLQIRVFLRLGDQLLYFVFTLVIRVGL